MPIVTAKEVAEGLNLKKYGFLGTFLGSGILHLTKLSELNQIYDDRKDLSATEFLDSVLDYLDVSYDIPEKDLKRIPKQGAFITISNHPLGAIDGMILMKLLIDKRPDYKVVANFLLQRLKPLEPYIMPVNPFEDRQEAQSSRAGIKAVFHQVGEGKPLGIFPAGEVSTTRANKKIVDKTWTLAAMKLIKKAKVPVIPIYFHGKNSKTFYRLAKISDSLRTAKIPSEMLSQYLREIKVRIGNPISVDAQNAYEDIEAYREFLRKKTYLLSTGYDKPSIIPKIPTRIKIKRPPKKVARETRQEYIDSEIEFCRTHNKRLLQSKNYEVFLAKEKEIPHIVKEIGRLRELTFRAVGEGTNRSVDLDRFDQYYHHLFLFDNSTKKIVGAYRMGLGQEIFKKYGIDGFYLQELFRFDPKLYKMMSESIEMGRAFIVKEYQKKPTTLFFLWKGIVHCTLRYPEHKYLIGGVSISNKFSHFSKSIMVEFMTSHYYDEEVAKYVHPKKEFVVKLEETDKDFVFDESDDDLNKFDKIVDELEPDDIRMPVLLKKYIKQNAKVVAFNVDPLFNDAVDGLMYIKIADLPESTVKPVMEEFQQELEKDIKEDFGNLKDMD